MVDESKLTEHQTQGYRPPPPYWSSLIDAQRLPLWSYQWAEAMELTPQVALGLAVGAAPLYQSEVEVICDNAEVTEFLQNEWRGMWSRDTKKILSYTKAGFGGLEVVYEWNEDKQRLELDCVYDFHPQDTKALTENGSVVGFSIRNNKVKDTVRLLGPKAVWLTYNSSHGNLYGRSMLRGAFEPWWEKTKPAGASDLRRLKYLKDSWIGDVGRYPNKIEKVPLPDGSYEEVSAHDLLQQMLSQRAAGGIMMLPSDKDPTGGHYLYDYSPPVSITGGADILAYLDNLDTEIWKGLLVPKEVIEAAKTGSGFSGRSIPMMSFLTIRDIQLMDIVSSFRHVFEFLVEYNWGKVAFEMRPKPLAEQFAETTAGTSMAGEAIGGGQQANPLQPSKPSEGFLFAIGDESSIENQAAEVALELGLSARRQIQAALKKNYPLSS
jgi:hypothetical protein